MNNIEFVNKAIDIAKNYKTLYIMGCFGAPMTDANKNRYCNNHSYNKQASRTKMIKNASADTFGFDCVCLIKGILWGWNGNKNKVYGGANYCSNGVPDTNADGMISRCSNVSTNFKNIEKGEVVWMKGHIGIYIGDGLAVECTPAWQNKVQITAVGNIGSKAGYNTRKWTKHGKLPYITYKKETSTKKTIDEVAKEVIEGKWGNGSERKKSLTNAGYNYNEVQARVDEILKGNKSSSFFGSKGYFSLGDNHANIGKIASFMYKTFPAYTKKEALGNYYGKNIKASITEFQKRTKLEADGCVGPMTLKELKKYGFKE